MTVIFKNKLLNTQVVVKLLQHIIMITTYKYLLCHIGHYNYFLNSLKKKILNNALLNHGMQPVVNLGQVLQKLSQGRQEELSRINSSQSQTQRNTYSMKVRESFRAREAVKRQVSIDTTRQGKKVVSVSIGKESFEQVEKGKAKQAREQTQSDNNKKKSLLVNNPCFSQRVFICSLVRMHVSPWMA